LTATLGRIWHAKTLGRQVVHAMHRCWHKVRHAVGNMPGRADGWDYSVEAARAWTVKSNVYEYNPQP